MSGQNTKSRITSGLIRAGTVVGTAIGVTFLIAVIVNGG